MTDPYRTPGEVITDEERYRRAHTAYWAMMAMDQGAYVRMSADDKAAFDHEADRLRRILTELGPRIHKQ